MYKNFKSHHIIGIVSGIGLLSTIFLGFILLEPTLHWVVANQKALKEGNEMRDFYLKLPVPLDFRVYFFNISNPDEVRHGKMPIVKEVGPYCYDAYKEKINVIDIKENDTLTYNPYDTYFFNQTRTGTLHQDDEVTILHPMIVSMINAVAADQPRFLSILNKALTSIFANKSDIYLTAKVRDILFDGVIVNCTTKDFSGTAVCSQLDSIDSLIEVEPSIYKFSLLGARNGTIPKTVTVKRGIKNATEVGRVVAVNSNPDLEIYSKETCNAFHGTDGWIFPSFLQKEEGIWSVAVDLCRSVKANFIEDQKYRGLDVRLYTANFGDPHAHPEEKCYCPDPEACPPKGVLNLSKCMKVPLLCTLPHFLDVDETVAAKVEGLSPDRDKHAIKILFEPFTGTPVVGMRRIQFNLKLEPQPKITIMNEVGEVIHPILWIQEGIELDGMLLAKITDAFFMLNVLTYFKYIVLVANFLGLSYAALKIYIEKKNSQVMVVQNGTKVSDSGKAGLDMNEVKNGQN